jgi:trigger factor
MIVSDLLRASGLKVDRERVNTRLADLVAAYPNADELRRQYLQNADAMRQLESAALEDQLIDWIVARAQVSGKPSSFSDLTGFNRNAGQSA